MTPQASAAYRGSTNLVSTVYDVKALTHGVCIASLNGKPIAERVVFEMHDSLLPEVALPQQLKAMY